MRIIVTNTAGKPLYEQIKEQIKDTILNDEIGEGDMLPSIRQLARDLKISVITTTRAYVDLEEEGYVVNVQGKGCYVALKNNELFREQVLRRIEDNFTAAVTAGRTANITKEELNKILELILEENEY